MFRRALESHDSEEEPWLSTPQCSIRAESRLQEVWPCGVDLSSPTEWCAFVAVTKGD